jgi:serine phosphatase RsbU (regulator of sigma subunit)/pSer/pThr/pTyr-binding forkhead associated (FHA) protein
MAYLRVIAGPSAGQICPLPHPECTLGRHPDCDVAVRSAAASRYHARIMSLENSHFLEDLESRNGTFLNEERIRGRQKIRDGDRIRISDTVFVFRLRTEEPARTVPAIEGQMKPATVGGEDREADLWSPLRGDSSSTGATLPTNATLQAQLKALIQITRSLRKALSLDEVLPQILDTLFVILPAAERGLIVLESEQGELEPRWVKVRHGCAEDTIRISRTVIRQVMESQEAIVSPDAAMDSRFKASDSLSAFQIHSLMCVPLVDNDGRSFGVLQVDTVSERDRFQQQDLDVLLSVATQASIAIDNARFHEYALRRRAIERDLEVADQIQRGFLPQRPPQLPGYEFFDHYQPASHVGGDFYDYVTLADGRLAVVVADVVGHGLTAAMLTAKLAAELRLHLLGRPQPAEAVSQLNASLTPDLREGHFITLCVATLVPDTGDVTIVNAGHTRPMLRREDGRVVEIADEQVGLPLGVIAARPYEQSSIRLAPGAALLIFTDGVNEAINQAKELYGVERMRERLRSGSGGAQQLGQSLVDDVERFIQGCPQRDDMCLVCIGRQ